MHILSFILYIAISYIVGFRFKYASLSLQNVG